MRTPNAKCCVCNKPLYRRPNELARVRHVACMEHRGEAQRITGLTDSQLAALASGRKPGTNNRTGYKHREESKRKASESHKAWCANNPDKVRQRAKKNSGPNNYRWRGGVSRLNVAIRRMTENRRWMDAVKARDGKCQVCGSVENLESHHIVPLSAMMDKHGIMDTDSARDCPPMWDISNGMTVCTRCHYKIHGRRYAD